MPDSDKNKAQLLQELAELRREVAVLRDALRGLKVDVMERVAEAHPPPYDSKSSGGIENAVKLVQ